jgi:hypothetical protein
MPASKELCALIQYVNGRPEARILPTTLSKDREELAACDRVTIGDCPNHDLFIKRSIIDFISLCLRHVAGYVE